MHTSLFISLTNHRCAMPPMSLCYLNTLIELTHSISAQNQFFPPIANTQRKKTSTQVSKTLNSFSALQKVSKTFFYNFIYFSIMAKHTNNDCFSLYQTVCSCLDKLIVIYMKCVSVGAIVSDSF